MSMLCVIVKSIRAIILFLVLIIFFPKGKITKVTPFARAMPDEYKLDTSIDTFTAYKMYIASKPWVASNYLRIPERKPEWV
jgi:hypothetical protein